MREAIDKIAERRIQEAIENGEFDQLPGQGKPLNLEVDNQIPDEMRAAYKILRNAGILPEELDLRNTIAKLEQMLEKAESTAEEAPLKTQLAEKRLRYSMLMEKRRKK